MQTNGRTVDYFVLWFRLSFTDRYAVWCSNDDGPDCVFTKDGVVPFFSSKVGVEIFANENQLPLQTGEPIRHNLDSVKLWLRNKDERINCADFLAAWNLFGDVAASFPKEGAQFERKTNEYLMEYNKLFYGNNLKAMRGRHPKYFPSWSKAELDRIADIMRMGLSLLKKRLRQYA